MLAEWNAAIRGAGTRAQLDDLAREMWRALAAGSISETDAETLGAELHRRQAMTGRSMRTARRAPSSRRLAAPERQARLERRRRLAASGPLPPRLAAHFTTGELSVLRIVLDEVRAHGACSASVQEIGTRAGVSRTLAKGALKQAARLGLLKVTERRLSAWRNLPNVIEVASPELRTWLRLGLKRVGSEMRPASESQDKMSCRTVAAKTATDEGSPYRLHVQHAHVAQGSLAGSVMPEHGSEGVELSNGLQF